MLAFGFILAGLNHFINAGFYLKMMPPILPAPLFLVWLSGAFEILLGVMLLARRFASVAAWGMIALMIAVFPANIYMAMNVEHFLEFSPAAIYWRLPFQAVLIAWAYWFTKR